MKYCVVNNHYPWQVEHQRPFKVMTNILLLSEARNDVSTKVIRFCISLAVTYHNRVSDRNGLQLQSTFYLHHQLCLHHNLTLTLCSSKTISLKSDWKQRFYNNNEHFSFIVNFVYIWNFRWICVNRRPFHDRVSNSDCFTT